MRQLLRITTTAVAAVALFAGVALVATGPSDNDDKDTLSLAAARPRGVVALTPAFVQPGGRPAAVNRARLNGSVRFYPRRTGRPVLVQRRIGNARWTRVAVVRQNRAGVVGFSTQATNGRGRAYTFRAVALRYRGERAVVSNVISSAIWKQRFVDQFGGTRLDGTKWAHRVVARNEGRQCASVGDPRGAAVANGTLRLHVKLDPRLRGRVCRTKSGTFRHYINGQISTQYAPHAFTRGVFAARMKFARPRGQHGAFWLQPMNSQPAPGRPKVSGAEIDIAEFFGQGYQKGGLASFLYNYGVLDRTGKPVKIGGLAPRATNMLPRGDNWWKSYHVFSVEWTPTQYIFRVDGREHFRTSRGVSGIDEYMILSMLTSDWELANAKKLGIKPGGTMHVDWVRVWQR